MAVELNKKDVQEKISDNSDDINKSWILIVSIVFLILAISLIIGLICFIVYSFSSGLSDTLADSNTTQNYSYQNADTSPFLDTSSIEYLRYYLYIWGLDQL